MNFPYDSIINVVDLDWDQDEQTYLCMLSSTACVETLDYHIQQITEPATLGLEREINKSIKSTLKLNSILERALGLVSKPQPTPMHC